MLVKANHLAKEAYCDQLLLDSAGEAVLDLHGYGRCGVLLPRTGGQADVRNFMGSERGLLARDGIPPYHLEVERTAGF